MSVERTLGWCSNCLGEIWSDQERFVVGQGPEESDTVYACCNCVAQFYAKAMREQDVETIAYYEVLRRQRRADQANY